MAPFLLVKVSVVNSASGSLSCNYATDLFIYDNYAGDNVYCIFAGFQVLLSVTGFQNFIFYGNGPKLFHYGSPDVSGQSTY